MIAHYSLHQQAKIDLEDIWYYSYQEWGAEQADQYLRSLLSRFTWLTENPQSGKKREDIKPGYYCFPEGKHIIFYKIIHNGIDVIGIVHRSMDINNHFD